jgi:hypothetical protein
MSEKSKLPLAAYLVAAIAIGLIIMLFIAITVL